MTLGVIAGCALLVWVGPPLWSAITVLTQPTTGTQGPSGSEPYGGGALTDIDAAAARIESFASSGGLEAYGRLVVITHAEDLQSLVVVLSASSTSVSYPGLAERLTAVAWMPVSVEVEPPGDHSLEPDPTPGRTDGPIDPGP